MIDYIKTRRSTRKFKAKKVEDALLNEVIEAGRYAPSGGNSQTNHFLLIENKKVLNDLNALAIKAFSKMEIKEDTYKSLANSIRLSKKGDYIFHYNCPVLIVVSNKKDYSNNIADVACALENMMIKANALDLGSVWINQLKWLNDNEEVNDYLFKLGMAKDERVYGALALGYADNEDELPNRNPLERTGNKVTYIK